MTSTTPPTSTGCHEAAPAGGEEELSAKSRALPMSIDRQTRQAKAGHVMTGQTAADDLRGTGVVNGCGTETVEAEDRLLVGVVDGEERLRPAAFMTLSGVAAKELIQGLVATVEGFAVMRFANCLFVPGLQTHRSFVYRRFGNARAAVRSLAFGAGGFSSKSRTLRLSLVESCT